ncbi:phosphate ABC transporter, inner membrane subunit PstC [Methanocaldococcus sp. FS406-22]|uniref:phosphate ABC transporter permease subunit PstC n=1 Tax=Methanocaldococcus sp. (strain FS406-22) TaxID=644281 RepID=UPI0001BF3550|nr:phosphate ABC transporter permease subunit PstC [Methanocaldococcus sp. FS406-22]ADC68898.1 phosphate ABC transporter, inner membrane subunit PstC [Methanocaldococcus sp. FS406-22]
MRKIKEIIIEQVMKIFAIFSSIVVLGIIFLLLVNGLPIFNYVSPINFIFGMNWNPDTGDFGIFPMIIGSFCITILALLFAVPLGVGCAIYLAEIASEKVRNVLKPVVEILTAIPSVVYGFVGMVLLVPWIREILNVNPGYSWFAASVILSIMILPTITSISEDAIRNVPQSIKKASFSLGATHWQTIKYVILPHSFRGILAGIFLAMGRAVGETMAVLMVAGNCPLIPKSIFDPVRPLTSHIILNIKEASVGSPVYYAMFACGIILLFIIVVLNICIRMIEK